MVFFRASAMFANWMGPLVLDAMKAMASSMPALTSVTDDFSLPTLTTGTDFKASCLNMDRLRVMASAFTFKFMVALNICISFICETLNFLNFPTP